MSPATIALRYVVFAALATTANIGTQHLSLAVYPDGALALPLAMVFGTGVGLVLKYVLDKRWIFFDHSSGLATHSRKFGLYTAMGLITTAIFWATEWAFASWFGTALMRDVGAVLGLAIGYSLKYALDRRFVFQAGEARA